jgi:hypothetical protein
MALDNPLNGTEPNERFLFVKIFLNYYLERVTNGVISRERAKLGKRTWAFWYHKNDGGDPCNVLLEGDQIAIFRVSEESRCSLGEYDVGIQPCLKMPDAI